MMKSDARAFADAISALLGPHDAIRVVHPTRAGLLPVCCFVFNNRPESGLMTAVTYGLSLSEHPAWGTEKPELILCVRSTDDEWGLSIASFAERLRGDESFDEGSILTGNTPLSSESEMDGFLLDEPQLADCEAGRIALPTRAVRLRGAYPIYECETDLIRKIGGKQFLEKPGADFRDVQRDHIWQ